MKKLKLEPDELRVESFPTVTAAEALRGTVAAAEATMQQTQCGSCAGPTCVGPTCYTSCGGGPPECTCPPPA
jgi:hypothetical protein